MSSHMKRDMQGEVWEGLERRSSCPHEDGEGHPSGVWMCVFSSSQAC